MLVVEVKAGQALVWGTEVARTLRERLGVGGRPAAATAARRGSAAGRDRRRHPRHDSASGPGQQAQAVAAYHQEQESGFQEQRALVSEARRRRPEDLAGHRAGPRKSGSLGRLSKKRKQGHSPFPRDYNANPTTHSSAQIRLG